MNNYGAKQRKRFYLGFFNDQKQHIKECLQYTTYLSSGKSMIALILLL